MGGRRQPENLIMPSPACAAEHQQPKMNHQAKSLLPPMTRHQRAWASSPVPITPCHRQRAIIGQCQSILGLMPMSKRYRPMPVDHCLWTKKIAHDQRPTNPLTWDQLPRVNSLAAISFGLVYMAKSKHLWPSANGSAPMAQGQSGPMAHWLRLNDKSGTKGRAHKVYLPP
jgi:hypothetical protein